MAHDSPVLSASGWSCALLSCVPCGGQARRGRRGAVTPSGHRSSPLPRANETSAVSVRRRSGIRIGQRNRIHSSGSREHDCMGCRREHGPSRLRGHPRSRPDRTRASRRFVRRPPLSPRCPRGSRFRYRHFSVAKQHAALTRRLRGHFNYFSVSGNFPEVRRRWSTQRSWFK